MNTRALARNGVSEIYNFTSLGALKFAGQDMFLLKSCFSFLPVQLGETLSVAQIVAELVKCQLQCGFVFLR